MKDGGLYRGAQTCKHDTIISKAAAYISFKASQLERASLGWFVAQAICAVFVKMSRESTCQSVDQIQISKQMKTNISRQEE